MERNDFLTEKQWKLRNFTNQCWSTFYAISLFLFILILIPMTLLLTPIYLIMDDDS